jgi:hypothetical protein
MKETTRLRRRQENTNGLCTARFSEDRYVIGIASKTSNILPDPTERLHLVQQGIVARAKLGFLCGKLPMGEEREDIQAIINGNENDRFPACHQPVRVVLVSSRSTLSPAMDKYHDRKVASQSAVRSPYIQVETILIRTSQAAGLRAWTACIERVAHT